MNTELYKRIFTSIFLLVLLTLMFFYTFILIISVIVVSIITWIEFYAIISKIYVKKNNKETILRFLYKSISLLYLFTLVYLIVKNQATNPEFNIFFIYTIAISVATDIGGYIVGKLIKGKKLTRISPKKTISGSIGSFIFSLCLIPFFNQYFTNLEIFNLMLLTLFISLTSQLGDLFISFLKRKAKVKNTSDLLPGHGGVLDRIDGIIFTIPVGFLLLNYI